MFRYDYNGEKKHAMVISNLKYKDYIVNIIYEDYEGGDIKFIISSNINDFYEENEKIVKITQVFINMLNENFTSWNDKVPDYIREYILERFTRSHLPEKN